MIPILILFASIITFSMESEVSPPTGLEENLIGIWVYEVGMRGNHDGYKLSEKFDRNSPGVHFLNDGKLIMQHNFGWCGTEPVSYSQTKGTWKMMSGDIVSLTYSNWTGNVQENWKIQSLSDSTLKIRVLSRGR